MADGRIIVEHKDTLWEWVPGGECHNDQCSQTEFCQDLAAGKGNKAICRALSTLDDGKLSSSPRGAFRKLHE